MPNPYLKQLHSTVLKFFCSRLYTTTRMYIPVKSQRICPLGIFMQFRCLHPSPYHLPLPSPYHLPLSTIPVLPNIFRIPAVVYRDTQAYIVFLTHVMCDEQLTSPMNQSSSFTKWIYFSAIKCPQPHISANTHYIQSGRGWISIPSILVRISILAGHSLNGIPLDFPRVNSC